MKEAISELRSTIRRLSPHLLAPLTTLRQSRTGPGGDFTPVSSVQEELQLETTKELVNTVASFVWELDQYWEASALQTDCGGDGAKTASNHPRKITPDEDGQRTVEYDVHGNSDRVDRNSWRRSYQEPDTEFNDVAKSLIRESYGIIVRISSPRFGTNRGDAIHHYNDVQSRPQNQTYNHYDELRAIVRTSILELLPSLSTSACRQFLLGFLPHFLPFTKRKGLNLDDHSWSPPSWLQHNQDIRTVSSCSGLNVNEDDDQYRELTQTTLDCFLDTFQSLIQTDPSTLASFLSTVSLLFESLPDSGEESSAHQSNSPSGPLESLDDQIETLANTTSSSKTKARKKFCHLCISSLPSVLEHDLPSIIQSLFSLVSDEIDARLAVEAVRKEWMSVSIVRPDETSVLFLGNVIVQCLLSNETPWSKHIATGFLDAISKSVQSKLEDKGETSPDESATSTSISTLDSVVFTALYSFPSYCQSIESIIDSLVLRQSHVVLDLILPLVRIWKSTCQSDQYYLGGSRRPQSNLILYERLVSPLISLLFYLMIATSSTCGCIEYARIGGILPFLENKQISSDATRNIQSLGLDTCKALSELYSILDAQKRDQVINTLLAMITESFVQSSSDSDEPQSDEYSKNSLHLISSAYSACSALMLLSYHSGSDFSQIRGTLLDRLLLLASISFPSPERSDDITYMLFDMNSAILMALMNGNREPNAGNGGDVAQIHIICQKLLFSNNLLSSKASPGAENGHLHRVLCGIILASRLLRCAQISRVERIDVWNSVVKMLSPTMTSSKASARKLHPLLGSWGLAFMRFAHSNLEVNTGVNISETTLRSYDLTPHSNNPRFIEMGSVFGEKDVFNVVNSMLAATGIIQMENSLKITCQEQSGDPSQFLAFHDVPRHFSISNQSSKVKTGPRFVICASYFLSRLYGNEDKSASLFIDSNEETMVSIHLVAKFIHELLDFYLKLGRSSEQGWNARGWLIAKVQLPCSLPESTVQCLGMKHRDQLELDEMTDNSSCLDSARNPKWKIIVADILNEKKSRAAKIQNLVSLLNCIIVSVSVSCAVLKQAVDHFQLQSTLLPTKASKKEFSESTRSSEQKKEQALRKLIQYQFGKIQHLRKISKHVSFVLKGLHEEVFRIINYQSSTHNPPKKLDTMKKLVKLPNDHIICSGTKCVPSMRISLSKLEGTMTAFDSFELSNVGHISYATSWVCLLDDADDRFLFKVINGTDEDDRSYQDRRLNQIICLRQDLFRLLQQHFLLEDDSKTSFIKKSCSINDKSLHYISRVFQVANFLTSCASNFSKMSTSKKGPSSVDRSTLFTFISSYYKLLLAAFSFYSKEISVQIPALKEETIAIRRQNMLKNGGSDGLIHSSFSLLVQTCVSVLDEEVPITSPISILSKVLTDKFIQLFEHECDDLAMSCHIIDLISIICIHSNGTKKALVDVTNQSIRSVFIAGGVKVGLPFAFFKIGQVINRRSRGCMNGSMAFVQTSFVRLSQTAIRLQKSKDCYTCGFIHHILAHWSALLWHGSSAHRFISRICESIEEVFSNSSSGHGSSSKLTLSTNDRLEGLNRKTSIPLYEILVQMVTTSLSLSKPSRNPSQIDKSKAGLQQGPCDDILKALATFNQTIQLFQQYHVLFPRRLFFTITDVSSRVVKLTIDKLSKCVELRNNPPITFHTPNDSDIASARFLQPLVDAIDQNCIKRIVVLCDFLEQSEQRCSYRHTKAISGLLQKCDGLRKILENTSRSLGLVKPEDGSIESISDKRHQNIAISSTSKKRRCLHGDLKFNILSTDGSSDELHDDGGQSDSDFHNMNSDSESFGAVGDWG